MGHAAGGRDAAGYCELLELVSFYEESGEL